MKTICHNFYRKIIFNASALRQENTTMSVVKDMLSTDSTHKLRLYYPIHISILKQGQV